MYYQVVSQCTQSLKNIETWLDKAESPSGVFIKDCIAFVT